MIIHDGQEYEEGEEVHDLGSFVCTDCDCTGKIRKYEGLSTDISKLPHYADLQTGSSALCYDNGDYYKYLKSTDTWYKLGGA